MLWPDFNPSYPLRSPILYYYTHFTEYFMCMELEEKDLREGLIKNSVFLGATHFESIFHQTKVLLEYTIKVC